jgi:hypothetical protein
MATLAANISKMQDAKTKILCFIVRLLEYCCLKSCDLRHVYDIRKDHTRPTSASAVSCPGSQVLPMIFLALRTELFQFSLGKMTSFCACMGCPCRHDFVYIICFIQGKKNECNVEMCHY